MGDHGLDEETLVSEARLDAVLQELSTLRKTVLRQGHAQVEPVLAPFRRALLLRLLQESFAR